MLWPNINEDIPSILINYYSDIVEINNLYKKSNSIQRIIRKISSDLGASTGIFLESWKKDMNKYDMIIIHANRINRTVPKHLRKLGYKGRIIYWFWNPVSNCVNPQKVDRKYCELWSFDKKDCESYNLKYNSTYYFSRIAAKCNGDNRSVFFIGRDKGRYGFIKELEDRLNKLGFVTDFNIIKDETSAAGNQYNKPLPYFEVVNRIKKSFCILDVVQKGQVGLSLRPMESVFFEKKQLTTNKEIKNEPFYNKNDFYIIGGIEDNDDKLKSFLSGAYVKQSEKILKYYDFENWIQRFNERL